ncbi:MAG: helix-turn-helix domain-containing protein [Atribacterota bacterium]
MIKEDGKIYIHIKDAAKNIEKSKATIWWWIQFDKQATKEQKERLPEFPRWIEKNSKLYIRYDDIDKLKKFSKAISYGDLSLENETKDGIDKTTHVTMSEAARLIDRTKATVSRWYKWYEEMGDEEKDNFPELPERNKDSRGWKWIAKDDIPMLEKFRDSISKGDLSKYTNRLKNN